MMSWDGWPNSYRECNTTIHHPHEHDSLVGCMASYYRANAPIALCDHNNVVMHNVVTVSMTGWKNPHRQLQSAGIAPARYSTSSFTNLLSIIQTPMTILKYDHEFYCLYNYSVLNPSHWSSLVYLNTGWHDVSMHSRGMTKLSAS